MKVSGYQIGVIHLHRAVDAQPPTPDDFLSAGEIDTLAGVAISRQNLRSRSYMEGISTWADFERACLINEQYLNKPWIAQLEVSNLTGIEAEHNPANGHHDLYGDRNVMRQSVSACIDATLCGS